MELDEESKSDLYEAFIDLQEEATECLNELMLSWSDKGVNSLFRAYHNIKGNAGMMGLQSIVEFAHQVEDVAGALRQNHFPITPAIGDSMMMALERLHDLHQLELFGKTYECLHIDELKALFYNLARAEPEETNAIAEDILSLVEGSYESKLALPPEQNENAASAGAVDSSSSEASVYDNLQHDLSFFQELALQLDNLVPKWEGRSIQLFDWAMKMNVIAGTPVDVMQFAAAIYMHDFGMSLLPQDLRENKFKREASDFDSLHLHPGWAHDMLVRMPGWEDAAQIVMQHHERIDGQGYPFGLNGDQIHDGAKVLAILDAFFDMTDGFVTHENRATTMNALRDINDQVGTAFEGLWVQCFNHVIRKELKDGNV